jgi:soluble P-type ATPase
MAHSFVAYIDEAGDDGLTGKFRELGKRGGSSHWLIVSATVMRHAWIAHTVRWRDEILRKAEKQSRELHFVNLTHGQRLAASQYLAAKPIRATTVISNKRGIPRAMYPEKNQLYFYTTRYAIERVSWICRDYRNVGDGDGRVKIIFSRRGGMAYEEFRAYLYRLRDQKTRIHWDAIDIDGIEAHDHSRIAALQIADVVTSAIAAGMEPDKFGNCEARDAITELKQLGLQRQLMITGDRSQEAHRVAAKLNLHDVRAEALPAQKMDLVLAEIRQGRRPMVVGDGINDALALKAGAIGIAMGAQGTDVALASADLVLMSNDLRRLGTCIRLSRKCRGTILVNVGVGLGWTVLLVALAAANALGPSGALMAAILHNAGTIAVMGNAGRLLKFQDRPSEP